MLCVREHVHRLYALKPIATLAQHLDVACLRDYVARDVRHALGSKRAHRREELRRRTGARRVHDERVKALRSSVARRGYQVFRCVRAHKATALVQPVGNAIAPRCGHRAGDLLHANDLDVRALVRGADADGSRAAVRVEQPHPGHNARSGNGQPVEDLGLRRVCLVEARGANLERAPQQLVVHDARAIQRAALAAQNRVGSALVDVLDNACDLRLVAEDVFHELLGARKPWPVGNYGE